MVLLLETAQAPACGRHQCTIKPGQHFPDSDSECNMDYLELQDSTDDSQTELLATVAVDLDYLEVQNCVDNLVVPAVFELGNTEVQHSTDHLMGAAILGLGNTNVQHSIDHLMMIEVMVQQGNLLVEHSIDSWVLVLVLLAAAVAMATVVVQGNMKLWRCRIVRQMMPSIEDPSRLGVSQFDEHIGSQQEVEVVLLCP